MKQDNKKRIIKFLGVSLILPAFLLGSYVLAQVDEVIEPEVESVEVEVAKDPIFTQRSYRIFTDSNKEQAKPKFKTNEEAGLSKAGALFRLKMLIGVSEGDLEIDSGNFRLQFAEKSGECDAQFVGEDYRDVTEDTAIAFVKSTTLSEDDLLKSTKFDPTYKGSTVRNQSFQEENNFSNNISSVKAGETGKWEFSLKDAGAKNAASYCFRITKFDGELLESYEFVPEVTTQTPVTVDLVDLRRPNDEASENLFPAIVISDTRGVITRQGGVRLSLVNSEANILWDRENSRIEFADTAKRKMSNVIIFEDVGKTIFIPVESDFEVGDSLTITGLTFINLDSQETIKFEKREFTIDSGIPIIHLNAYFTKAVKAEMEESDASVKFVNSDSSRYADLPKVKIESEDFYKDERKDFRKDEDVYIEISDDFANRVTSENLGETPSTSQVKGAFIENIDIFNIDNASIPTTVVDGGLQENAELPKDEILSIVAVEVLNSAGNMTELKAKIVEKNGSQQIEIVKPKNFSKSGAYKIKTSILVDGIIYEIEDEFTLGVLAINTDKDTYKQGESGYLQYASLTEHGHTICDTNLKLTITKPNGSTSVLSTENGGIIYSAATCAYNNYTHSPDYYSNYIFTESGTYEFNLENLDNGYSIEDEIKVTNNEYVVERATATRTNPFLNKAYRMDLKIHSESDTDSRIVETLPAGFSVAESIEGDYTVEENEDGTISVIWDVALSSTQVTELFYEYYNPAISPQFYLIGPVKVLRHENGLQSEAYVEDRQWQIASDVACTSEIVTGNWNAAASWTDATCGASYYPSQSSDLDTAVIADGATITLTTTEVIAALTLCDTQCDADTTLTQSAAGLTVNGAVLINGGFGSNDDAEWYINANSATTTGAVTYELQSTTAGRFGNIVVTTGVFNSEGTFAFDTAETGQPANMRLTMSGGAGTAEFKNTVSFTAGDVIPGTTSIINYYSSAVAQTVVFDSEAAGVTYANLHINNTHASGATLGAAVTATNLVTNLRVQSGTLFNGGFAMTGGAGDTFEVASGATFTMTGGTTAAFPASFGTYTLNTASTVNYNQDSAQTISARTYGTLNITPTLTAARIYTGTAFTVNDDFTIRPSAATSNKGLLLNMGGTVTVAASATTTISGNGAGPATSTIDLRPSSTDYNISTGHLEIAANGALDGTSAVSTITLTGTDVGGILFTSSGTFTAGSSEVIMNPDADVNLTSGTFIGNNAFYKLTLSPALVTTNRTYTFGSGVASTTSNFTINPSESAAGTPNLTVNLGAWLDVGSGGATSITAANSATSILDTRPATVDHNFNSGTLTVAGAGTLDASGSASIITLTGTSGTLFSRQGTFTAGSSEVIMNPNSTVSVTSGTFIGSNAFHKLTFTPTLTGSVVYTFGAAASTTGDFMINPSSGGATLLGVYPGGDITVAATATTTIKRTGSSLSAIDLRPVSTDYNLTTGHLDIQAGGTLDATGAASVITLNATVGTLFSNAGTFTQGTSDVQVKSTSGSPTFLSAGTTFHKLTIDSAATAINAGAAITMSSADASNTLAVTVGTLDDGGNQIAGTANGALTIGSTGTLKLGSAATGTTFPTNYTDGNITLNPASTVVYNSGANQTIKGGTFSYGNLQLSRPSGTPNKTASDNLVILGNLTIDASNTLTTTNNITLSGNYTNNGTLTTSGTFTLNGSAQQTLSGTMTGSSAFSTLIISNSTGTNPTGCEITDYVPSVIFSAAASATNFNILTANVRVRYNSGSTYTFTNINWNANPIYFRNSAASGTWTLNVSGTQTAVSFVNVSRSDATPGNVIVANDGTNTDCNNNTDWDFVLSNTAPVITNMYLNGGSNLTLNESTFKWATTSFLITDAQYCSTLSSVVAKMYIASTSPNSGTVCSANDLSCYSTVAACAATTTGNTCGASDTTVEYDCAFKVWYIARATDSGAPWATSIWSAAATATDSGALTGSATSSTPSAGIEINTLRAIDVTTTIPYDARDPNSDSGATNKTVVVTNTGNVDDDLEVSGTSMTCGGCGFSSPIVAAMQEFFASTFTYGSGTDLSGTPQNFDVNLLTATVTTTPSTVNTYWGLGVAGGTDDGAYTGTNTFTPIAPF